MPTESRGQSPRREEGLASRWFARGTGLAVFGFLAFAIGSVGFHSRSDLDVFLRRSRAERVDAALTPAQAGYELEARDGRRVRLQDVRAPLVFLNFWGTFCPPCIEELPSLLAMARARQGQGVLVLAVSYDESFEVIDRFFREFTSESIPENFVVLRDPETATGRDMKALFGTEKIPESYLIQNGRVLARFVNARDWTHPDITGLFNVLLK